MSAQTDTISEDEAALYDRQIRLWGLECQKRIRDGKILVLGLNGLGAEVVKNLTLSGVKRIVIMDNEPVKPSDATAQFFAAGSEVGINRAEASKAAIQELNPNVEVIIDKEEFDSKSESFIKSFNVVCACDCTPDVIFKVNRKCRELNVTFFSGSTFGLHGYCFVDTETITYTRNIEVRPAADHPDNVHFKPVREIEEVNEYCLLESAFSLKVNAGLKKKVNPVFLLLQILFRYQQLHKRNPSPQSREADILELQKLRAEVTQAVGCDEGRVGDDMLCSSFGELSPVCAIVGGVYANEIIKSLSNHVNLMYNFFLFNGEDCNGVVEAFIPPDEHKK
ncbi:SUMO-activating enzyme subunit 1-like isoform X2 [Uloborus diversus]|nr:SUMO-activating enzyme subunit 1-like isoform X2 [Uloborus diversus]